MSRQVWKCVVGLSTLAGSLGLTIPANATLWQNAQLSYGRDYLTIYTGSHSNPEIGELHNLDLDQPYSGLKAQAWGALADPYASGYFRFFSGAGAPLNPLVLDIRGGVPFNQAFLQAYPPNGGANQSWLPVFQFQDALGASCYTIHSRADTGKVMVQYSQPNCCLQAVIEPYNDSYFSPGQYWCAYTIDNAGSVVPQIPPPF